MYLINESIDELKKFFQEEIEYAEIERRLQALEESEAVNSVWNEYQQCPTMGRTCMRYKIDTLNELVEILSDMWEDHNILGKDEFIKLFAASAFRQLITDVADKEVEEDVSDISISPFIYNF